MRKATHDGNRQGDEARRCGVRGAVALLRGCPQKEEPVRLDPLGVGKVVAFLSRSPRKEKPVRLDPRGFRRWVALLTGLLLAACTGGGARPEPLPPVASSGILALTTNFQIGSFSVAPLDDPAQMSGDLGQAHGDSVARAQFGAVYVVNRYGGDNIQRLDPERNFATLWQCSVGNGSNPHDLAQVASDKAYVTRYEAASLAIVDPSTGPECAGFLRGEVDLSAFADADSVPEMDQMVVVGEYLFVSLQRLDRRTFEPSGQSLLAVIDTSTDSIVDVDPATPGLQGIELLGRNPFAETKGLPLDPLSGKILVASVGSFARLDDGGIEIVNPWTLRSEGFLVTAAALGGNINDFVIAGSGRGYAVITDERFNNSVIRFDPSNGTVLATLLEGPDYLPDIEWVPERGWLLVADQNLYRPGIWIFTADDKPLDPAPIRTGSLPPFNLLVLPES